jgi:hypothetical protein
MGIFWDSATERAQKENERLEHEEAIRLLQEAAATALAAQQQAAERLRQLEEAERLLLERAAAAAETLRIDKINTELAEERWKRAQQVEADRVSRRQTEINRKQTERSNALWGRSQFSG